MSNRFTLSKPIFTRSDTNNSQTIRQEILNEDAIESNSNEAYESTRNRSSLPVAGRGRNSIGLSVTARSIITNGENDSNEDYDSPDSSLPMQACSIITNEEDDFYEGYESPDSRLPVPERIITDEESFWNYIESLNWRDRSDNPKLDITNKKLSYKRLSIPDQEAFADYLTFVVYELHKVMMLNVSSYRCLTDDIEQKAICSHVVGKGSIYYAMTMEDPGFSLHLIPESPDKKEYYDMMEFIRI